MSPRLVMTTSATCQDVHRMEGRLALGRPLPLEPGWITDFVGQDVSTACWTVVIFSASSSGISHSNF